jgi:hypothetical protein
LKQIRLVRDIVGGRENSIPDVAEELSSKRTIEPLMVNPVPVVAKAILAGRGAVAPNKDPPGLFEDSVELAPCLFRVAGTAGESVEEIHVES